MVVLTRVKAKEYTIKMLEEGLKNREVITEIMGKFGYPYSSAWAVVQEANALIKAGRAHPDEKKQEKEKEILEERATREEAEMRSQWGNVKVVDEE